MNKDWSGVDLHTHTTASDGQLSPAELLKLAAKNHTKLLAITDHDTIAGYLSVRETAASLAANCRLISGVEISTTWAGQSIHIVGLNFNPAHLAIKTLLTAQTTARRQRCQIILDRLAKHQMPINWEELQQIAGHDGVGRPHIAQAMINKGYVNDMNKAFKKYLGAGKIGDVKSGWSGLSEVITAINDSGGVAVIAHPNKYKMTRMKLLRFIDEFIEMGGQGLEVISARQTADITEKYIKIANNKGLYASLGSDFHRHTPYTPAVGALPTLPQHCTPIWQLFYPLI